MFNNKDKNKTSDNSELEYVPKMHTMKDDLGERKEESTQNTIIADDDKKDIKINNDSQASTGSPFLINGVSNRKEEVPVKNLESISAENDPLNLDRPTVERHLKYGKDKMNLNDSLDEIELTDESNNGSFYLIAIILILIIGGGGYYLWSSGAGFKIMPFIDNLLLVNNNSSDDSVISDIPNKPKEVVDVKAFSDKSNFLVIESGNLNKDNLTNLINKTFSDMKSYEGNQLEFVVVDQNNKPVPFRNFMEAFEISLSSNVLSSLSDDFSIFLSKKDSVNRIGLSVTIINGEVELKENLKIEESILIADLNNLLLGNQVVNESGIFSNSSYNDIAIRYFNLNPKPDLSIDYAIVGDNLIFGTSKDSTRLIIDKIKTENVTVK